MIEIKHLKTLQALRNCGSLAAAAATLHQTQSALSHQFSDLEQRLGFRLFVRKSQPLRFTPQGEILLQLANQVLPQIASALQSCNEPQQTRLRIAIECHSCIQWLTPALENFRQRWPQVEMDFKSGVTFDPQPSLQQGELDLVMTSDILPRSGLHYSPMFDYEVRLVLAPDHPLASKTRITPEDLASETLLIYPVQRSRLDIWRHFLQPAGISPQLKSVDNTLLLIQMVAARMGIAALPHWVVESFERQGLVVTKTLGEGLWSRLYAAVRDGEQRQPITEAFIRSARNHACDHLPFVRSAERPNGDGPTAKPESLLPNKEARPVRLLLPDGKVHQQPCRHMHVVHDPQRTGVYLRSAVVPHEVPQPRCHHAQPDQNAPLQACRRELLRVAEHKPCRHRDDSCPHIEPGERVMLWHRTGFHQALVPDHTDGKAEVRQLHEHQPGPEVVAHFVVANNRRPDHRQRRAQQISPAQTTFAEQIVNQRDIERRKHGEKQKFRDRQVDVSPEAEQVHDAELYRPHQHVQQNGLQRLPACTQEGQEYQRRQPHAHQHREVAVDVPGEVFANQAKREGPQDSGNNE